MRGSRAPHLLAAAGCGVVLLLSGCSSDGGDDGTTSASGEVSPLGEYYERLYPAQSQEEMDAQTREREALIAACMQEQGFEYLPLDPATDGSVTFEEGEGEVVDYGSEEYVATHGYGISTYDDTEMAQEPAEEYVDPNEDAVGAMSESERTAFYEALYGPPQEYDEDAPEEEYEYDWTTAGCSGAADHEVNGDQAHDDPAFASLQEDMDAMYASMSTGPEVAALDAEWASCMAGAGYPGYAAKEDASTDISERMNALWESTTEADPEPDAAALEEVREAEIDTALADLRCTDEVGYDEEYGRISTEIEQEFVDAHRAELDAWVEAHGQAS